MSPELKEMFVRAAQEELLKTSIHFMQSNELKEAGIATAVEMFTMLLQVRVCRRV